jgi:hypothetical protein
MLIVGCTPRNMPGGYADPPLLYAAPWLLRYTDTVSISGSSYQMVRIPASGCALTDTIRLLPNETYVVSGACGPSVIGNWISLPDSTFDFRFLSDTLNPMATAQIHLLTRDSMILIQRASFRNPVSLLANFVTMGYSH